MRGLNSFSCIKRQSICVAAVTWALHGTRRGVDAIKIPLLPSLECWLHRLCSFLFVFVPIPCTIFFYLLLVSMLPWYEYDFSDSVLSFCPGDNSIYPS
jgi:hypothetical protein